MTLHVFMYASTHVLIMVMPSSPRVMISSSKVPQIHCSTRFSFSKSFEITDSKSTVIESACEFIQLKHFDSVTIFIGACAGMVSLFSAAEAMYYLMKQSIYSLHCLIILHKSHSCNLRVVCIIRYVVPTTVSTCLVVEE